MYFKFYGIVCYILINTMLIAIVCIFFTVGAIRATIHNLKIFTDRVPAITGFFYSEEKKKKEKKK